MNLIDHLKQYPNLPNVDGEGFLFAFSGMDGETNYAANFVLTRHSTGYDFLIQTPFLHELRIRCAQSGDILVATGDVFAAVLGDDPLVLTFSAWHTLIGHAPQGTAICLSRANKKQGKTLSICNFTGARLAFAQDGQRFALAFGATAEEARSRAQKGLHESLMETVTERLAPYARLPHLSDGNQDRLLRKCFSVMKVNAMAAEGQFKQHWSTPDRVPHRDMWLWDSVFHSLAMNTVDGEFSWEYLKSVLDQQQDDGMIAHQFRPTGWCSTITQPPILAWGVWENYQVNPNVENLAYAADKLGHYLKWDMQNRDQNGNGLLEWFIEENETCRSGESGMDNSQRFDEALLLDAVDFSTFAALDMASLAKIYAALEDDQKAVDWQDKSSVLSTVIHRELWNEDHGFYLDRKLDGSFSPIEAVTGFLPLLLDDFPSERLPQIEAAMEDMTRFNTPMPIPSVSLQTPNWSTDMWRGASWINMNYLVAMGFEKQGCLELAKQIRAKTLALVGKYYQQDGVIYEFYDSLDQRPPSACDRKGARKTPYDIRRKMDSIRDYHWSAALSFLMLVNEKA